MKKTILILSFVVLSFLCAVVFTACGGEYSDGLNFVLLEDGTYGVRCGAVTGSEIVIPEKKNGIPVTKVLNSFFMDEYIEYAEITVRLNDGITEICEAAFKNASVLTRIELSPTVKHIGHNAFKDSGLAEIVIPQDSQLSYIGSYAFSSCEISEFTAPSSLMVISVGAYESCDKLELIDISRATQLKNLPVCFASGSAVKEVMLNEGLETIGESAFKGCALHSVSIPESVKKIEHGAFGGCFKLKKVDIPVEGSLEAIFENAFQDCNGLNSFILPKSLNYLEANAFRGCNAIFEVYDLTQNGLVEGRVSEYLGIGGLGIVAVHNSLDFDSVLSVTDDGFIYLEVDSGYVLVGYDGSATEIRLPERICGATYNIAPYAFFGSAVTTVVIPEGVTCIGEYAFFNSSLASINIPVSVGNIGKNAFLGLKATIAVEGETYWYEFIGKSVTWYQGEISDNLVTDADAEWERTLKAGWY